MKNIFHKIKISNSTYFLILLALLAGYVKNVGIMMIIFVFHEIGHIMMFLFFKIKINKIVIYPFGGLTKIEQCIHQRIYIRVLCSLGGIIFQILLAIIYWFLFKEGIVRLSTYKLFVFYNKVIIFFNLLPIRPLDGNNFLLAILLEFFSFRKSYLISYVINFIYLVLFIVGNYVYRINNLVIIVFLIFNFYKDIKEYKYLINNFYLERIMHNHFYNGFIYNCSDIKKLKINKYYFFKDGNRYINEKEYIRKKLYDF